jgi:hypothetical protein
MDAGRVTLDAAMSCYFVSLRDRVWSLCALCALYWGGESVCERVLEVLQRYVLMSQVRRYRGTEVQRYRGTYGGTEQVCGTAYRSPEGIRRKVEWGTSTSPACAGGGLCPLSASGHALESLHRMRLKALWADHRHPLGHQAL